MEKPDFESMLKKNAFKIHPLDTERAAVSIDHADWCFEHVWNTHVVPLQEKARYWEQKYAELGKTAADHLEFANKKRLKNEQLKSDNKLLREEIERLKAELNSANAALDNISERGNA